MDEEKTHTIRLVEDPWATVRHIIEAAALVAAGAWAFYTFIYQEKIKPANEPATLVVSITAQRVGQDRTRDILDIAVHWHNAGKTELEVAANGYNVWGYRYARTPSRAYKNLGNEYTLTNDDRLVSQELIASFAQIRNTAIGGMHDVHTTIAPDSIITVDYIIVIPRGKYDVIEAQVLAAPVRAPVRQRPAIQIARKRDGSIFLTSTTPGVYEDDNRVELSLLPD
jgi:hypothetical protein